MKVFVGIHEHSHGTDARVFKHEQSVWIWRERIADEWWKQVGSSFY